MTKNNDCFVGFEYYNSNFRGLISRVFSDYDVMKEYLISIGYCEKEKYHFELIENINKTVIVHYKIYINK